MGLVNSGQSNQRVRQLTATHALKYKAHSILRVIFGAQSPKRLPGFNLRNVFKNFKIQSVIEPELE